MKSLIPRRTILAFLAHSLPASAVVNISWTTIGNPGNAADTTGYGSVSYAYNIGTYDVTNAQYVEFLNAKGSSNSNGIYSWVMGTKGRQGGNITRSGASGSYSYSVSSAYANLPVVGVTWFDAARFCNWLGNGQGSGSMETGAYTLNGANIGIIIANVEATVFLPTEDEWYKAAYYNGATSTYSRYPNGQNTISSADANYWPASTGLVNVGYGTPSSYGAYGMGGNVNQWNDAVIGSSRGKRGGSWEDNDSAMASSFYLGSGPSYTDYMTGFRVASIIPEPSCVILTLLASEMLLTRRKR